jgi:adenylosuccinate synthase
MLVSTGCPIILPHHIALDKMRENVRGNQKIGTTGRGIGPAYEDKVARRGLRVGDLFDPEQFKRSLEEIMDYHNFVLEKYFRTTRVSVEETLDASLKFAEKLKPMVGDVVERLAHLRKNDANILFEGAQGSLLDIDQGTYPYVTSSNTTAGSIGSGCGVGPMDLDYILGITKAYTTRVGSGPFPTELFDSVGSHLASKGKEVGATTGRPRRCGWFDAHALKRVIQINSISGLCVTKLDVLDGLDKVAFCVGYDNPDSDSPTPIYEEMAGWQESTVGLQDLAALPANARAYLDRIESACDVPIDFVSTGPDRADTIALKQLFD